MKNVHKIALAVVFSIGIVNIAAAGDKPEEVLKAVANAKNDTDARLSLDQRWRLFLDARNWGEGVYEGGVITFPERSLIVSSASEFTRVSIGQPGWIESRIVAFERAELEAKVKIIRFLAEASESKRSLDLMEKATWSDGTVAEVKQLSDIAETLDRLKKKTLALSDAALDSVLRKLDSDYDPSEYEKQTQEERKTIVEDIFQRKIRNLAFRTSIGVTPVYTSEGKVKGEYQVLIGVVWSPKLNRLAMSLFNDEYNIPPVSPGKKISTHVPKKDSALLGTLGTRIVIDEKGDYAVLAYAQAQPRRSSPSREQSALHLAKQIAAERARAQIVNYIREGLTMRSEENSRELSREFSDLTVGTETLRKYRHRIKGRKTKVKLSGLRVVREWNMLHPETGQKVAGAIVAWSPSSARMSEKMDMTMKTRPKAAKASIKKIRKPGNSGAVIESMPVDTSAY